MKLRTLAACGGVLVLSGSLIALARQDRQRPGGGDEVAPTKAADADDLVRRMMAFDKDKGGTLTRSEITDDRLLHLFDRADADKDGAVTKDELVAIANKEHADDPGFGGPGGPGGGPPPGMGGPPPGMMPRPGEILPPQIQRRLALSNEQIDQIAALQKEVDARLEKILDANQMGQLKELRSRPPGGPGGGRRPGR